MRCRAQITGTTLAIFIGALIGASAAVASPAQVLLDRALSDARASGSVRVVGDLKTSSDQVSYTADLALSQGHEQIRLPYGTIDVILTGGTGYLRASTATGLVQFAGWPVSLAKRYAGRWVRYPASNRGFAGVTSGLTLVSAVDQLAPSGRLTDAVGALVKGLRVTAISGSVTGGTFTTSTMYVTASSDPLPVRLTAVGAGKLSQTATLSHWGEHVAPRAPAGAVAVPSF